MAKQHLKPVEQAVVDPAKLFLYLTFHLLALDEMSHRFFSSLNFLPFFHGADGSLTEHFDVKETATRRCPLGYI